MTGDDLRAAIARATPLIESVERVRQEPRTLAGKALVASVLESSIVDCAPEFAERLPELVAMVELEAAMANSVVVRELPMAVCSCGHAKHWRACAWCPCPKRGPNP